MPQIDRIYILQYAQEANRKPKQKVISFAREHKECDIISQKSSTSIIPDVGLLHCIDW